MSLYPTASSDQVSRSHQRSVKTGVGVHIPHDILKAPNVVQALVWNKISSSAISAVMHEIVATSEGDPSKLSLSYASTERYRIEAIQNITEKIAENWTPPAVANIHWDGKLMKASDGVGKVERLPVLLFGIGGTKLLGVPAIRHKSSSFAGSLIADASDKLIKIWDCQNSLAGMVFDTTSLNTGAQTVACVALQNTISKSLLWFTCRHHVVEVVLGHVWDVLKIEVSKSPEIQIFQRFRKHFSTILTNCKNLDFCVTPPNLTDKKDQIIEMSHNYLKQPFSRGDNKELVKLTLLYLGDPVAKRNFASFNRPGAMHKARWISKNLYAIKLDLLGSKLSNNLKGNILLKYINLRYCIFKTFKLPFDHSSKSITGISSKTKF